MSGGGETVVLYRCTRSAKEVLSVSSVEPGINPRRGFPEAARQYKTKTGEREQTRSSDVE